MDDQSCPIEPLARLFVEQCHRDIKLAWLQIEAAKEVLANTRWLLTRWAEQSRMEKSNGSPKWGSADPSEAARMGMFVMVESETGRQRERRNRFSQGDALLGWADRAAARQSCTLNSPLRDPGRHLESSTSRAQTRSPVH